MTARGRHELGRSNHRETEILQQIRLAGGACRVAFLADRLGVSEETVRRNIRSLELNGHVRKVHGGVHLLHSQTEQSFQQRMDENPQAKRLIAAAVADLIKDGDSLFLDIGSTTAYIAKALQDHNNLFVVTNSVSVAHTLSTRNGNRLFMAGGELRAHDGGTFGMEAVNFIRGFNVQYAVLSVGAIDGSAGFMLHDMGEAELSSEAIARAQTRIVAADSGKFGRRGPIVLKDPARFDILVTDAAPPADITALLAANDIDLVIAGGERGAARRMKAG